MYRTRDDTYKPIQMSAEKETTSSLHQYSIHGNKLNIRLSIQMRLTIPIYSTERRLTYGIDLTVEHTPLPHLKQDVLSRRLPRRGGSPPRRGDALIQAYGGVQPQGIPPRGGAGRSSGRDAPKMSPASCPLFFGTLLL